MDTWKWTRAFLTIIVLAVCGNCAPLAAEACRDDSQPTCDCDGCLQVYGEFLYWKTVQDQIAFAAVLPGGIQPIINEFSTEPVDIAARLKVKDTEFEYKPGFRVGVGYSFTSANWDIQLAWTSLHEKISSKVTDPDGGVFPLTFPTSILFGFVNRDPADFDFGTEAKSHWKLQFDTVDLEVGKTFCFCETVGLRPFLGLKIASIRQKQYNQYLGFTSDTGVVDLTTERKITSRPSAQALASMLAGISASPGLFQAGSPGPSCAGNSTPSISPRSYKHPILSACT